MQQSATLKTSRNIRHNNRAVTLIEVLIVIAIAALLAGGMAFTNAQIQRSRLKGSATRVAAAMRVAFQRASASGKTLRLVFDFDQSTLWIEQSSNAFAIQKDDPAGGADPATESERAALAEANRINAGVQPPRASFESIDGEAGKPQSLQKGTVFRAVDTMHDKEAKTSGRAYVYFFGSEAERASVQLSLQGSSSEKDVFSVVLSPLTAKANIIDGVKAILRPKDDAEASEAEDASY